MFVEFVAYWRVPIGDSGLLDFYLKVMGTNEPDVLPQLLHKHILRLVGNLAADCGKFCLSHFIPVSKAVNGIILCVISSDADQLPTKPSDENRSRVVASGHLKAMVNLLTDD